LRYDPRVYPTFAAMSELRVSRRTFAATLALLAAWPGAVFANTRLLPRDFDPSRDAARDLESALRIARASGRNVIVDVGGEWCSWCHVMDRLFASDPVLDGLRDRNFVWLKINYSPENKNEAFLRRWPRIDGYPHLFVLGPTGRLLQSQDTRTFETGKAYDPAAVHAFLVKWAPQR
jgi:thiol:disulfide interchange protein